MRLLHLAVPCALSLIACIACNACSGGSKAPAATTDAGVDSGEERMFGGDRPVSVRVPDGYDPKKPAPLLLMLHGYGAAGLVFDVYLNMASIADAHGFFYVAPDGTVDKGGSHFWNATDACCNFDGSTVDDVAYLTALVKEIEGAYSIDPKRIYVLGHSNGGFMAHRLACEHAETFAAIVSFAGAVWADPGKCTPSAKVSVLQIHGTADKEVLYAGTATGGSKLGVYPGAEDTVAIWAKKNGCTDPLVDTGTTLHVDADFKTKETSVLRHDGCAQGSAAELWRVGGAPHIFAFAKEGLESTWTWLDAHPKP